MHFDLADMRLIVRIAEHSSVTKGAESSHLSVPAASIRIKNLEESVGAKLLHRSSQGVTLTPPGEAFVRHARTVLGQIENLQVDLKDFVHGVKGRVRLGTTPALSGVLPPVLARYLLSRPEVSIELREQADAEIIRSVGEGSLDLGVVAGPISIPNVEGISFCDDALSLVVPAGHEFARRSAIRFAETRDENLVGLPNSGALGLLSLDGESPDQRFRARTWGGDAELACQLVASGIGLSVMPRSVALRHARNMAIVVVPLADAWAARSLKVCVRKGDALPVHVRALVNSFVVEEADGSQRSVPRRLASEIPPSPLPGRVVYLASAV